MENMTILDTQLQPGVTANSVPLCFEPCADTCRGIQTASEVSKRFLRTAELLPVGEYLGLQIYFAKEKFGVGAAFSSSGAPVALEDYSWLFRKCAKINPLPTTNLQDLYSGDRKVYRLSESDIYDLDAGAYDDNNPDDGLFEMLHETGAVIRIVAGASVKTDSESEEEIFGHAAVYISLLGEISLRARSAFAYVFPDVTLEETSEAPNLSGTDRLSDSCFQKVMRKLLCALTIWRKKGGVRAEAPISIDELELSVRAYNCLKRAGINTVNELLWLDDDKLRNIRNLGRKSYEEIQERLREMAEEKPLVPLQTKNYTAMLEELIGLDNVKEQIRRITAFAKMKQNMQERGLASVPVTLNMEFVGNPGTAKTTVARIVAGIFHETGLLAENELIEVGRADLVARYEGQTATKVKEVFGRAKGRVLFIDEAYSLVEHCEGEYGDEAINTLVQEMENHREDTIVIFAGYPDKMKDFFDRNPGLRSRVPFKISFSDYSAEEMARIAESEAGKRGFSISGEAHEKISVILSEASKRPDLGNGRFCRNLIENALLSFAARIYGCGDAASPEADFVLSAEDFSASGVLGEDAKKTPIGFQA